jgi:iron complex transport system substrate-binding protein
MRRALLAPLAVAVAIGLAACSGPTRGEPLEAVADGTRVPLDELVTLDDPGAYVGESTALIADAAIEPVLDDPEPALPVTVTSRDLAGDVEVTVDDASRIVAMDLSGSLAATVWGLGLGDALVGRDTSTTFPGTEDLPEVTSGGHNVNAESVLGLDPSVVITDGSIGPNDVVLQLRDAGIAVVFVDTATGYEGVAQQAREVAAALGVPEAGELLAERTAAEIESAIRQIAAIAPADAGDRLRMAFLYLRGSAGIYYLFGEESGADELITALGGIDAAGEIGWTGMMPATDEAITELDPDLVLVMTGGLESVGGVDGLLEEKPAVALTRAGQNRRFVDMADGQILSFGPRSAEVLDALARAIYAPEH